MHQLHRGLALVLLAVIPEAALAQADLHEQAAARLEAGTEAATREAIQLHRRVIAQDSLFAPAYFGLAKAYRQGVWEHDWDAALLDSVYWAGGRAILHDPRFTEAYAWMADTYRAYVNHSAARLLLADAVSSNPDDPLLLTLLGRNYFDTGDCAMARLYLERAVAHGAVPLTHRFLGWCAFYRRQPEEQQEHFRRYLELEPDDDQGLGGLVWSYTMQGRYGEAIAVAERFLEEKEGIPNYSWIVANAAEVHLFAGNEDRARALYERALAIDSSAINQFAARAATTTLGHLYWKQGRTEEAEELFGRTVARRRGNIAWAAEQNGIPIPERWEYAYDLASVYAAKGERGEAYRWLFRAVMGGYPAHQAFDDPLMAGLYDDPAYKLLMQQARLRIESTWDAASAIEPAR